MLRHCAIVTVSAKSSGLNVLVPDGDDFKVRKFFALLKGSVYTFWRFIFDL